MGPYQVIQHVGQCAYKQDLKGRFVGVYGVFHASHLKPHIASGSSAAPPQTVEVEGEAQCKVKCPLRHRVQCGGTRYLVQCMGYGPEQSEWVCEEELNHAKTILEQHKRSNGLQ